MDSDDETSAGQEAGLHETSQTTSSRCVTDTFTGTHNFEVLDFSSLHDGMGVGQYVRSEPFTVGGYDWYVVLYPDGLLEEDEGAYVSVYLCIGEEARGVRTKYTLSLVDKYGRVSMLPEPNCYYHRAPTLRHTFRHDVDRGWGLGCPRFVAKYKLRHFLYLNDESTTLSPSGVFSPSSSPELKVWRAHPSGSHRQTCFNTSSTC
jgi:speckle-type POZ protein